MNLSKLLVKGGTAAAPVLVVSPCATCVMQSPRDLTETFPFLPSCCLFFSYVCLYADLSVGEGLG